MINKIRLDPEAALPLAIQIANQIIWLIASGALKEGDRLPSVRLGARQLGVHMHTVRAAYQQLESEGLVITHQGRGSFVQPSSMHAITRQRSATRSHTFGVLLPGLNPVYALYLQGINDAAREANALPLVCLAGNEPEIVNTYLKQLLALHVDGVLVTSSGDLRPFSPFHEISHLLIGVDSPSLPGPAVRLNSEKAAYLATRHLIEHGHKRIALLTCTQKWEPVEECVAGYQKALIEFGLEHDAQSVAVAPSFSRADGYAAARDLFNQPDPPSALFAIADELAFGAMTALYNLDMRIPQDVAITSYNNLPNCLLVSPSLTSASLPAYEMGLQAVRMLYGIVDGHETDPETMMLDTELIVRQSCGCR